ncbi:hypothetical protein ACFLSI_00300 [Bacteroidota bacterium]
MSFLIWYNWMTIAAFIICMIACLRHIIKLIRLGNPTDYSKQAGNIPKAIQYSFTKAMSPQKKESAFLHLPTYIAGIFYHLGTFLSIFIFFSVYISLKFNPVASIILTGFLILSGISGLGILIKRIVKKNILALSNPDDFISNILVTLFQFVSAYILLFDNGNIAYSIISSLLLLYIPLGKLKHAFYFFAARYQLGFFYGWRNIWPISNTNN